MSKRLGFISFLVLSALVSPIAVAQHGMPGGHPMSFFVTSEPVGDGGDLGGLDGADAHCQSLATAVGAGDLTWRAYLSTQERPGTPAVNARDRIGHGNQSWNSSHATTGCSQADFASWNGAGLFYCFAVD